MLLTPLWYTDNYHDYILDIHYEMNKQNLSQASQVCLEKRTVALIRRNKACLVWIMQARFGVHYSSW